MKKIIIILCCTLYSGVQASPFGKIFCKKTGVDSDLCTLRNVTQVKSEKETIEEMVLEAIAEKKYTHVENLLRLQQSIADDAETIKKMHDTMRESYKEMQDSLVKAILAQRAFVPRSQTSEPNIVSHDLFFDRMLGHIAYGIHHDKPAILKASNNVAILSVVLTYLNTSKQSCDAYNDNVNKCSICLDAPGCGKNMIACCEKGHKICVSCFNNPDLIACPLCRGPLPYRKTEICQSCGADKDLTFTHCNKCNDKDGTVNVLCNNCTTLPCCNRNISSSKTDISTDAIKKQALSLIKLSQSQRDTYEKEQRKEMDNALKKEDDDEIQRLQNIATQLKTNNQKIEDIRDKNINHNLTAALAHEHNMLVDANDELVKELNKRQTNYTQRRTDIKTNYTNKIDAFTENKNREIESIKAMAEKSTDSALEIPKPQSSLLDVLQILQDQLI